MTLRSEEGANPYGDPVTIDFLVTWSREEYEAGMADGGETFPVTGVYGEPDWDALKGWTRAEGTAVATVAVEGEPTPTPAPSPTLPPATSPTPSPTPLPSPPAWAIRGGRQK